MSQEEIDQLDVLFKKFINMMVEEGAVYDFESIGKAYGSIRIRTTKMKNMFAQASDKPSDEASQ